MSDDNIYIEPPITPPTPPEDPPSPETETRDVIDSLGHTIGTLTLLAGLAESVWTTALSHYNGTAVISIPSLLSTLSLAGTGSLTSSSGTFTALTNLSATPEKGSYLVFFSGNATTNGASAQGEFGIFVNGSIIAETKRSISCNLQLLGGLVTISLNTIAVGTYTGSVVSINNGDIIDVRYRSTNGGTIGFAERTLTLLKVS